MALERTRTYGGFELFNCVKRLIHDDGFDPDEFVLAGSARLWVDGIVTSLADIDMVARGDTLRRAFDLAFMEPHLGLTTGENTGDKIAQLFGGRVNVSRHWIRQRGRTDELIAGAELLDLGPLGLPMRLRFIGLEEIAAYKRELNRPKDRDILATLRWLCY